MTWTERGLHPQPWHIGHGCITADAEPNGEPPSAEDHGYYGGAFVCEGISDADAAFIMVAIRQRDLLLQMLHSPAVAREMPHTKKHYRQRLATIEQEVQPEIFRAKALAAFRSKLRDLNPWWCAGLLPEFASRARTEPYAEVFVPSGRFVSDNVEMAHSVMDPAWNALCYSTLEPLDLPF